MAQAHYLTRMTTSLSPWRASQPCETSQTSASIPPSLHDKAKCRRKYKKGIHPPPHSDHKRCRRFRGRLKKDGGERKQREQDDYVRCKGDHATASAIGHVKAIASSCRFSIPALLVNRSLKCAASVQSGIMDLSKNLPLVLDPEKIAKSPRGIFCITHQRWTRRTCDFRTIHQVDKAQI